MSKKKLLKLFIVLVVFITPFVFNYIKLEQLIAIPVVHKYNDWSYMPSKKFGFHYFLEVDYVKIKSANEEKIITLYYFDTQQLVSHEPEKVISDLNILSKIKFVIVTTLASQSKYSLIMKE